MDTTSSNPLLDAIRVHRLLDAEQFKQLDGTAWVDAKSLAKDLIERGWLTPYQANQLLNGKGQDLVLGSYILMERLGEGGMGQVFKARHRTLGRICAVKLIRKERTGSADAVKRFQREVRSAAALAHPNIVLAYDADEIAGTHLMVMEYIDGATDLSKLVKKNGPLPVERACEYIRQAALGLQHAHERGMVHRDIKPANLLLTTDGTLVKVLDMGLARLHQPGDDGDSSGSGTMTHEGAVMGTPDYIAPEQALDTHTVDIRADLYSLGCTFYFLLTGRVPFPGGTLMEKLCKHQFEEPSAVEKLRPEVPPAVARVVRKLMAKRPDERYQTPAELAAVLSTLTQSLTGIAASPLAHDLPTDLTSPAAGTPPSGDSLRSALAYMAKRSDTVAFEPAGGAQRNRHSRRRLMVALGTVTSAIAVLTIVLLLIPVGAKKPVEKEDERTPAPGPKKVAPAIEYALAFDGTSSYVSIPSLRYGGDHPLTVEAWAVIERAPGEVEDREVLLGNPEIGGFAIGAGKTWDFGFFDTGRKWYVSAVESQPLPRGKWIHLAGVYDGKKEIRFYVEGRLQKRAKLQGNHQESKAVFALGADPDLNGKFRSHFLGRMNGVRISRIARYDDDFKPQKRFAPHKDTVALYHFAEGAGDVLKDSSGNGYHGQIVGARWVKADGSPIAPPVDYALHFDGNSHVDVPGLAIDASQPFTLETYAIPDKVDFENDRCPMREPGKCNLALRKGCWVFNRLNSSTLPVAPAGAIVGKRVHLAGVYDGVEIRLYVDGKLVRSSQKDATSVPVSKNPKYKLGDLGFIGLLDEIRISKVARYDKDFTPAKRFEPDKDTIALYHFDEGAGDVLKDSSGNGHDGKIVGAKWVKADGRAMPVSARSVLHFDGTGYVVVEPAKGLKAKKITVEGWVALDGPGTAAAASPEPPRGHIFRNHDQSALVLEYIREKDGSWRWRWGVAHSYDKRVVCYAPCEFGRLVHVAGVFDGDRTSLFLNGRKQDSQQFNDGDNAFPLTALQIGGTKTGTTGKTVGTLVGKIFAFRISKFARYDKDFTPAQRFEPDQDTVALYHCDEGFGDVLKDSSGNGHHGKIVGAKWVKVETPTPHAATIDLLPLIDPAKDAVKGDWKVNEKGDLVSDARQYVRIRIPYRPPAEYNLLVSFTSLSGREGPAQILVGGGRQFRLKFGGFGNAWSYFDMVDGKGGKESRTAKFKAAWVTQGLRHESRVEVRKDSVKAYLDNVLAAELLQTDFKNVDIHPAWGVDKPGVLGLVSNETPMAFHKVRVVEISGPGTFTRPDDRAAKKAAEMRKTAKAPLAVAPFDAKKAQEFQQLWAAHLGRKVEETNSLGMKLRLIPPGEFIMGDKWHRETLPLRSIRITKPQYIGALEVTCKEYLSIVKDPKKIAGGYNIADPELPIGSVSWDEAVAFCEALSAQPEERTAGRRYRLPTEAEWEYACRAGTNTHFSFGDVATPKDGNFKSETGKGSPRMKGGSFPANAWGLFDMHGNLREWCSDWWDKEYPKVRPLDDPKGPATGTQRECRGGGSNDPPTSAGFRFSQNPDAKWGDIGFRVVCEIAPKALTGHFPSPGHWQPLLDPKLSKWGITAKAPASVVPEQSGGETVAHLLNGGFLWPKFVVPDHHLRLEFQFPGKQPSQLRGLFGTSSGSSALAFTIKNTGDLDIHLNNTSAADAVLQNGEIVPRGVSKGGGTRLGNVDLGPSGTWNRLDIVRVGDRLAFYLNGRFINAVANLRWLEKGKQIEPAKGSFGWSSAGEVLMRRIEVRDITAFQPELIEPGPWRSMMDGTLSPFVRAMSNKPEAVTVTNINGEPVVRIVGAGRPYVYSKARVQNMHLRLQFQTPQKGVMRFGTGQVWPGGRSGIGFHIDQGGKSSVYAFGMKASHAAIERGAIVSTEKATPISQGFSFADATLEPPGNWNRLDLVRADDRFVFFINGRFLGAVADIRGMVDGNDFGLGEATINLSGAGDKGEALIRKIEIRDITAFRPELLGPGPWQPLLDGNLAKWWKHDNDQPEAIAVNQLEGESVLRFRVGAKDAYVTTKKTDFSSHHLTLEFQFPPGKGPGRFTVGPSAGSSGGVNIGITHSGTSAGHTWRAQAAEGLLERGLVVTKDAKPQVQVKFAAPNLRPAGAWNRLDLVRLDDTLVCFVNGRFIGALADVRQVKNGKELKFGGTEIVLNGKEGEVLIRGVKVRAVTALPPELTPPSETEPTAERVAAPDRPRE